MNRNLLAAIMSLVFIPASAEEFAPPSKDLKAAAAGEYVLESSHASLHFGVSHLGFSQYVGQFKEFDVKLEFNPVDVTKSKVEAVIKTTSLSVGSSPLEAELLGKQVFDTEKFPQAKFIATSLVKTGEDKGVMTGTLTIKDVTKPVTLEVGFYGHGINPFMKKEVLGFSAEGKFKRSDFGIVNWLPAVGDDVEIKIEAEFVKA